MTLRTAACGVYRLYDGQYVDTDLRHTGRHYSGAMALGIGEIYGGSYIAERLNHVSRETGGVDSGYGGRCDRSAAEGFPADGTVEALGQGSDGNYRYRYTEGPRDNAFMEKKDREYLTALKDSDDPAVQARFEEEFATLDLSLEHHRNLKREFEPFTRAYHEAAGGGGEGGRDGPEQRVDEDHGPKVRGRRKAERRGTSVSREGDDQANMSTLQRQIDQQAAQLRTFQTELETLRTERSEARTTTAALREQVGELMERLETSQTAIDALRTEHAEALTTTAALREQVNEQAERLSASQARVRELEASLERLRAERTEDRRLLERHSGSLARLGEASDSHATALATLQNALTESLEAQRRTLQQGMDDLEARLARLSSETRDTKQGSQRLRASYEELRASLALAGHLIVRVDRSALTLSDPLGEGELTVVYEATWQELPCVYQHLKVGDISDTDSLTYRREALSLITMKHPRLTSPYAYTDRPCGVLMPRRVSLRARIAGSPLSWEMRYRIAHNMAQGLAYLHEQGQVHGHLKPANVLLDDDERASLSDFGMSQTRRLISAQDPAYLAPETQKRHPVNDERSDVYSFGIVLWSMATGRAPFSSTPDMATLRTWIAAGEKETLPAGTPAPYKEIVERCWLSPEARPRAQDLVRTLGHVLRPDSGSTDLSLGRSGGLSGAMHSLRASYLNLPESSHIDAPLGVIHASPVATETSPGSIPPPGTDTGPPPSV